ncbi:hypothetical protein [Francisella tularensis]|uniref:hypothetical protein n=1 Tax=Francisella tularensis TaxID=263 RepID=UPI0008F46474|nr:hypothetical protein [Francisella tularensis]APA82202.1 hypothetical protein N894_0218 [Francisella tularensis subsp. novicida PA10-7858]
MAKYKINLTQTCSCTYDYSKEFEIESDLSEDEVNDLVNDLVENFYPSDDFPLEKMELAKHFPGYIEESVEEERNDDYTSYGDIALNDIELLED